MIDHAFVPIRDLYAAAESRRDVSRRTSADVYAAFGPVVPGGCWPSDQEDSQENILSRKLYSLIETLTRYDIPTTFLHFPKLARVSRYAFDKLKPILTGISFPEFERAFHETCRPEKIHAFDRKHS